MGGAGGGGGGRHGIPLLLVLAAFLVGAPGLGAQQGAPAPAGALLVEGGVGLLQEDAGTAGRVGGGALGLRLTLATPSVRPVLAVLLGFTELSSGAGEATDRSWLFLSGGAEVPLARDPVEVALTARLGAGRRHDTLGSGLASSPHWTPVGVGGLVLRGTIRGRWGWQTAAAAIRDDLLDTLLAPEEDVGRNHWTLEAGVTLRP